MSPIEGMEGDPFDGDGTKLPKAQIEAMKMIGLTPKDEQLFWIAEHAAHVELPPQWVDFDDEDGNKAYYQPKTRYLTTTHPIILKYNDFVEKTKRFMEKTGTLGKKIKPHLAVEMNEVLNRCYRELPPVTPEILERMCVDLYIDTSYEFALVRRVKTAVEAYAEDQYDIALQAHQKADMDAFLHEVREEQIRLEVLSKPDKVIMCTEVEGQPARVKCEQCKDFFSLEGYAATHSTGKRRNHDTLKCEQTTCSVYPDQLATCEVDNCLFCDKAYEEVAIRQPHIRQKRKRVLGGLTCSMFPNRRAQCLCEDCSDLFCMEAFLEIHRRGNRRRHVPLMMDENGQLYRSGEICSPEENARLVDRARLAREGGCWLAFMDDQLNTYWYHLADKITTTQNPYL